LIALLQDDTDGASGADFVAATAITETGAAATVQDILEALAALDALKLPLAGGTLAGHLTMTTAKNIIGATAGAGTMIGSAANQKFGRWGATPVVQQSHIADLKTDYTTGDLDTEAEIITALNATNTALNHILAHLEADGLNATS